MKAALVVLLALLLTHAPTAMAHPVAQGTLRIDLQPQWIVLHARVAAEEIVVANAFAADAVRATSTVAVLEAHGRYLAKHIRVFVGDRRLDGHAVASAHTTIPADQFVDYELRYARPAKHGAGEFAIRVEQDVLNEFEFAPGNRWEATFVVSITAAGRTLLDGRLLTSRAPLTYLQRPTAAAASASNTAAAPPTFDRSRSFFDYLHLGVQHILGGYDHLLFIGALVLAAATWWDLVKVVTVFTVAHSLTLTLSVLNLVRLPEHVVEPVIAVSIVVVALGNLAWKFPPAGISMPRWRSWLLAPAQGRSTVPLLVVFGFGLFHGLGFAGGLLDATRGSVAAGVALAIIAFSVGVELGHQVVVLPLFAALRLLGPPGAGSVVRRHVLVYASSAVLVGGVFYLYAALTAAGVGVLAGRG